MQTFLPYKNFYKSAATLDNKRLGNQRLEASCILNVLVYEKYGFFLKQPKKQPKPGKKLGWSNHPAARMWRNYENALATYMNACIDEWIARGMNNTMKKVILPCEIIMPHWLGNLDFHNSHRSNLLRKKKDFYSKFNWAVDDTLPYVWPV